MSNFFSDPLNGSVSVVIPTYKRHDEVIQAIRSALAQTLAPMEVLVVNDGPDLEKGRLIAALGDERVYFHEAPRRGNASATRNFGIHQAKGNWIALLDDDDIWLPHKLEVQFAALERVAVSSAILAGREAVYHNGRHLYDRPRKPVPLIPVDQLLFCGFAGVNTSTLVAPTTVFKQYLFNEEFEVQEDMSWMLHAGHQLPVIVADEIVAVRHMHPGEGLSRSGGADFSRTWYELHYHLMSQQARAGFVSELLCKQAAYDRNLYILPWIVAELRRQNRLTLSAIVRMIRPWVIPHRVRTLIRRILSRN